MTGTTVERPAPRRTPPRTASREDWLAWGSLTATLTAVVASFLEQPWVPALLMVAGFVLALEAKGATGPARVGRIAALTLLALLLVLFAAFTALWVSLESGGA
ncbi:hypothetical protein INN71_15215 [Nocardioides sp. ChNu-153]|uniref:hypothetical protein n=1 Tax=unclassified Nocardioides TaxID=2615069 RepID=UPI002406238C|nr:MULTISPECIES: hypothetical protein [unclassified Nocardioides]MDF9716299.1 hypothetical protein [Nocardioides sp. ChNu-99]MDN7122739.1 hypothetical protein [Nocardioides sp. ChNu-153]